MGVSNAGKTHTTFGELEKLRRPLRHEQDGLVPRVLESFFSQFKHHVSSKKSFAVRMMLLHVENDTVHDLLFDTHDATIDTSWRDTSIIQQEKVGCHGNGG